MKFKKFKKVIKDNIKRISCVVLSMLLLFTFTITSLAFDGEMESNIDKEILKKYLGTATVLYNPNDLPVYSPFNKQVLDLVSTTSSYNVSGWELSEYEYLAVTQKSVTGKAPIYYTYYVVPQRDTNSPFKDFSLSTLNPLTNGFEFCDFYEYFFNTGFSSTGSSGSISSTAKIETLWKSSFTDSDYLAYINCLVYVAAISSEGTLLSVSENYYGEYAGFTLPSTNIVQIYYHSSSKSDFNITNSAISRQDNITTKNLNYLVSTTTMASMGYESFGDAENILGFYSSNKIPFCYETSLTKAIFPTELRGPNYPSGNNTSVYLYSTDSDIDIEDEGVINKDRAFLILPMYYSQASSPCYYFFVFPENTEPIIYFKFSSYRQPYYHSYSSYADYASIQVLSKVDYVLYGSQFSSGLTKMGSFDSTSVSYTCDAVVMNSSTYSVVNAFSKSVYEMGGYTNNIAAQNVLTKGQSYNIYPHLMLSYSMYGYAFNLGGICGNKMSFSIFRSTTNNLGFYTYVSPDLKDYVLNEGGGISGSTPGNTPGTDDGSWEFTIEYDKLTNIKQGLPEPPDSFIGIFDVDISDFWKIPENLLIYFSGLIEYFVDLIEWFFSTYGGPLSKFFMVVGIVFNNQPDLFKAVFIISLILFLMMKLLQYSTITMDSLSSYSNSLSKNNKEIKYGKNKKKNNDNKDTNKDTNNTKKKGSGE